MFAQGNGKKRVAQPNLVVRSIGKTKSAVTVARKATHHPIAIKMQREKKMMTLD